MKLICDGFELSEAVNTVLKATAIRSTNPILEGIKLKAENDVLTLQATDLELSIQKRIVADVKIEGETVVAGRFFAELIKKLNNEKIEITKNDSENTIKIKYTDSEGFLQTMPVSEFPDIRIIENAEKIRIKKHDFKELVNKTAFSAAYDDARPVLKGILMEVTEGKVNAVALDGYRMAVCTKAVSSNSNFSFIAPARSLTEINKIIDDNDDELEIYIQKNFMQIAIDETHIITRLIDGDFINYKQVIPNATTTVVTVAKRFLEEAIERASLLARLNKNNLVTLDIKEENIMSVSSTSDLGNIREKISISTQGKDLVIAFNARYFSEALKNIADEYININFTTPKDPCTITASENSDYLFLILPVRIVN